MTQKEIKELSTEKIISRLCCLWSCEKKWARRETEKLCKELQNRLDVNGKELASMLNDC